MSTAAPPPNRAAQVARAKAAKSDIQSIKETPISRPGLGKPRAPGQTSGGTFALRKVTFTDVNNIKEETVAGGDIAYSLIDPNAVRVLCVPMIMEQEPYPTQQPTEVCWKEAEAEYATEAARDRVLASQSDPFWYEGRVDAKGKPLPANLGFVKFIDPIIAGNADQNAGKAYLTDAKRDEYERRMAAMASPLVGA